jgi:hypothetical protein
MQVEGIRLPSLWLIRIGIGLVIQIMNQEVAVPVDFGTGKLYSICSG